MNVGVIASGIQKIQNRWELGRTMDRGMYAEGGGASFSMEEDQIQRFLHRFGLTFQSWNELLYSRVSEKWAYHSGLTLREED